MSDSLSVSLQELPASRTNVSLMAGLSTAELDHPVCPLCDSASRVVEYRDLPDYLYGTPGRFGIVRCQKCGLRYLYPRPRSDRILEHYPESYRPWVAMNHRSHKPTLPYRILDRIARFGYRSRYGSEAITWPPFGQGRLLDVGCGDGSYLESMQQLGWDAYGVDLSARAVEIARSRVGLSRVSVGGLKNLDPALGQMDLITMHHFLEHVTNPRDILQDVRRRLAPTGKLQVIVPDLSGFEAKLFRRFWIGLDVPRHCVSFARVDIETLLLRCGFVITSSRPQYLPDLAYGSFIVAIRFGLPSPWRNIAGRLTKPVLALCMISYVLGNRGAIQVVAKRSDGAQQLEPAGTLHKNRPIR